jgi:arylformamidase
VTPGPALDAGTPSELDVAYDNARAVADTPAILERWDDHSSRTRARLEARPEVRVELDVRYAPGARGLLDLFAPRGTRLPTLVFIHGGYWHLNTKDRFSFVVEGPLSLGMGVVVLGYDLAPTLRVHEIVQQVRAGVGWVVDNAAAWGGDAERIAVGGWSAGGHLAAMAMSAFPQLRYGLAVSGIFDLGPIRSTAMNQVLRISEDEARAASPLHNLPGRAGELTIAFGGEELPELQRQSRAYYEAWRTAGLKGSLRVVPDRHHFAVLEELGMSDGDLVRAVAGWTW